jgi:hypothetical protein
VDQIIHGRLLVRAGYRRARDIPDWLSILRLLQARLDIWRQNKLYFRQCETGGPTLGRICIKITQDACVEVNIIFRKKAFLKGGPSGR